MTEVFRKYGAGFADGRPEDKEPIACVVSHPDAGGTCRREAIGEVWSLPFCKVHGREAELAAQDEMATSLEGIFTGLGAVERERHDRNEEVLRIIKEAAKTPGSDTLRYDYGGTGMDNPHDWWCEAQLMVCRFMRQAHDRGLAGLLTDPEYAREGDRPTRAGG